MLREQWFETGTVGINYAEGRQTGRPFVVLHGGSSRWQYATAFIEALSAHWHVYAPDLRGHGNSGLLPHVAHVRLEAVGHELHGPPGQELLVLQAITPFLEALQAT
jgi:alpha-beta hydrolase superfamily lysophospholipase